MAILYTFSYLQNKDKIINSNSVLKLNIGYPCIDFANKNFEAVPIHKLSKNGILGYSQAENP